MLSWDIAGQCDIRAMTYVLNSYLRRHDTFHRWLCSRMPATSSATPSKLTDIELVPTVYGEMTPAEWRSHIRASPNPPQWAISEFMIIQPADHFTFWTCIDHIHIDFVSPGMAFNEIQTMYASLVDGGRPIRLAEAGSYDDYCVRQRAYTSALTSESPEIRRWIEFAENNSGTLPECPLPLGDPSASSDLISAQARQAADSRIRIRMRGGGRPFQRWCVRLRCSSTTRVDRRRHLLRDDFCRQPPTRGLYDSGLVCRPMFRSPSRSPHHLLVIPFAPRRHPLIQAKTRRMCYSTKFWSWRRG